MSTGYVWHELFGWADSGSGGMFPADQTAGLQPIAHGRAVIETLAGVKVLDDALFPAVGGMTGHALAPHQKVLVGEVTALVLPA